MNFIEGGRSKELKHLLRFHIPESVYGDELVQRFEIDALIEYYNLLLVAVFSGYVPGKLDEEIINEIVSILDHPSVTPYYTEHYKYKMVSQSLQYARENRQFNQEGNAITISVFNEFIALNRVLKRDKDIERFLGMLDHVSYSNQNLTAVTKILSSYTKLNTTFTTKEKTTADHAVWGFIKYTVFLSQLKALLLATTDYPLFQSSIWMFHGYYFEQMIKKVKIIFTATFDNLEKVLSNKEVFKHVLQDIYQSPSPENIDEEQLMDFAKAAILQSKEDVAFVLNEKWGYPLKEYFKNSIPE
ncbi:MAG: hypothetical protein ABI581_06555 [Sediminibacterium sp.]